MNDLTASLYGKVAAVTQHSMVQRSMIMNLNQDFCDGLFYVAFRECYSNNHVPTMSDDFDILLQKLNEIQWNSLTWMEYLPNYPENFANVNLFLCLNCHNLTIFSSILSICWTSTRRAMMRQTLQPMELPHHWGRMGNWTSTSGSMTIRCQNFRLFFGIEFYTIHRN